MKNQKHSKQDKIDLLLSELRESKAWEEEEIFELAYDLTHLTTEQMFAFASGTLKDNEREEIERHLATCDFCLHQLAEVHTIVSMTQPPSLWERIRHVVEDAKTGALKLTVNLKEAKEALTRSGEKVLKGKEPSGVEGSYQEIGWVFAGDEDSSQELRSKEVFELEDFKIELAEVGTEFKVVVTRKTDVEKVRLTLVSADDETIGEPAELNFTNNDTQIWDYPQVPREKIARIVIKIP